jgi:hypothetical protein
MPGTGQVWRIVVEATGSLELTQEYEEVFAIRPA